MFERFTDRARQVMALANQEAQRLGHGYIGTEHVLLGLVKEGHGVGATVLYNLGIDLPKVRLEVEKLVKSGVETSPRGKLPQTPRAKDVIKYATEEARRLGYNYVGTEHLLLGLLRETDGVAAQVLMNLGLKLEEVREEVLNLLGECVEWGGISNRLTDRARKVLRLASEEAQRFNHEYIGTEHILLGLGKEGSGVGMMVLKKLDIDLRKVRLEVEKFVKSGPDMVAMGTLPQTPQAKKVIEYAIEESRSLENNYVGTEHLLLGLLREKKGMAAHVLIKLGVTLEKVREAVLILFAAGVESESTTAYRELQGRVEQSIMFDRFTDRARKVIALANQEAQLFNHEYLGTEHLLLGLVKEGSGLASRVLRVFDVNLARVRSEVEKLVKRWPKSTPPLGKLPLVPRVKNAIRYAIEESEALGHERVGTGHLLLGLLREMDSVAAQILMNFGLKLSEIRAEALKRAAADGQAKDREEARKRVLDLAAVALEEASLLGQKSIREGHILLALLRNAEAVPGRALVNLGVKVEDVVAEVKRLLKEPA